MSSGCIFDRNQALQWRQRCAERKYTPVTNTRPATGRVFVTGVYFLPAEPVASISPQQSVQCWTRPLLVRKLLQIFKGCNPSSCLKTFFSRILSLLACRKPKLQFCWEMQNLFQRFINLLNEIYGIIKFDKFIRSYEDLCFGVTFSDTE